MNSIRLYFRYVGVSLRAQMQYRASTIMAAIGQLLITVIEFVAIWALFRRFGSLRGWSLPEVGVFYGLINIAFALSESIARGFDTFPGLVRSGDFDRVLLRPRSAAFQIAACEVQLLRVGRLTQALVVLAWASASLNLQWDIARVALVLFAVLGGMCMFYGLFVAQAVAAFWTIDSLELFNTITYGGCETGQYPLPIYRPWFRKFFTFVVPLAAVTYFPGLAILSWADTVLGTPAWFHWASPAIGIAFMAASFWLWGVGLRHYRSTGS